MTRFSVLFNQNVNVNLTELYSEKTKNNFVEIAELTEYKKLEII